MNDKNIILNLNEIISDRFSIYSKYIIQERSLPDIRDGLKPVQRRILYAMNNLKLNNESSYKKCARIIGEVIGKYHPHGDSAVYDTLIRLSQNWKMNYPLVTLQGNNGSIDGDPPAAMRYTEVKLSKISNYLLVNTRPDIIDFVSNFDDNEIEPSILAGILPNLLINGSVGISSGYATNIPPHNLKETVNAIIHYINNPNCSLLSLMELIKGPDFPTKGIISNIDGIKDVFSTGKGKIYIEARMKLYRNKIIIHEIPYETLKINIIKEIQELINLETYPLRKVYDNSGRNGLEIIIELKNKYNYKLIKQLLFHKTQLQVTYNMNMVAIIKGKPILFKLKDYLYNYHQNQIKIFTKLYQNHLLVNKKKLNLIEGLIKASLHLEAVIKIIRRSQNKQNAIENLMMEFEFNKEQAQNIVNLQLFKLTSTEMSSLINEQQQLINETINIENILSNSDLLNEQIILKLKHLQIKFNDARKSIISNVSQKLKSAYKELSKIKVIKPINFSVSYDGYINVNNNVHQKLTKRKNYDLLLASTSTTNNNKLAILTNKGFYFQYQLSLIKYTNTIGDNIVNWFKTKDNQKILLIFLLDDINVIKNKQILISTKNNLIKIINLGDLINNNSKRLLSFVNLVNDNTVVGCELINNPQYVVLVSQSGLFAKYNISDLSQVGPNAQGTKAMKLKNDETLLSSHPVNDNQYLAICFNDHFIKFINTNDIKLTNRPSVGLKIMDNLVKQKLTIINKIVLIPNNRLIIINQHDQIHDIDCLAYIKENTIFHSNDKIIKINGESFINFTNDSNRINQNSPLLIKNNQTSLF